LNENGESEKADLVGEVATAVLSDRYPVPFARPGKTAEILFTIDDSLMLMEMCETNVLCSIPHRKV
jgi:hypothetical protein